MPRQPCLAGGGGGPAEGAMYLHCTDIALKNEISGGTINEGFTASKAS